MHSRKTEYANAGKEITDRILWKKKKKQKKWWNRSNDLKTENKIKTIKSQCNYVAAWLLSPYFSHPRTVRAWERLEMKRIQERFKTSRNCWTLSLISKWVSIAYRLELVCHLYSMQASTCAFHSEGVRVE